MYAGLHCLAVVQNLGSHQRHITIVQKQQGPQLASIGPPDRSGGALHAVRSSPSAAAARPEGQLWHADTSSELPSCCVPNGSPEAGPSDPKDSNIQSWGPSNLGRDSFENVLHHVEGKINDASAQVKETTAAGVLEKLRSSEKTLEETRFKVQSAQKKVEGGRLQTALRGGKHGLLARRSVPWLWNVPPGVSASVQAGVGARLPVESQDVLGLLRGRVGSPRVSVAEGNGPVWETVFAPIVRRLSMQPLVRARLEGTYGRFRNVVGDHTSAVLEIETCSRGAGAARAGPDLLRLRQPAGLVHVVSLSAKQQVLGPLRACADVRWEMGPYAAAQASPQADGVHLLGRVQRYCQKLEARSSGLNLGLDVSFGVARAVAWYSVLHKQGMIELRV